MVSAKILGTALLALASLSMATPRNTPAVAPSASESAPAPAAQPAAEPAASGAAALTAEDLNAWLDGYMPYALHSNDIAGAVVAVVKDGQIVTERGFGYSDVEKRAPVDPKLTLFRPGSVSKLVTWTAVMQLVEQGKIDLDADVNPYLDFKIPALDGKPITMRNLMQHTAGFEEQAKGIISEDPHAPGYVELLKQWVPTRVFAPGTTPAYSNYGASLAAYIVQRLSGENFDDYVEKHIFAMSAPGEDMAHFMIAHLQNGEYHGNRILKAETAQMMHDSPLTLLPPLNRMELGFFETNINGREVIGHLGDTELFHTSLHLFLKENVGFFVSFNSRGKEGAAGTLRVALFEDFADRYFPDESAHDAAAAGASVDEKTAAAHARMMVGHWSNSRGSQDDFLAALGVIGQTKVSVDEKGHLIVPFPGLNGQPRQWRETTPFVWRDLDSHERIAAKVVDGRVVRYSIGEIAPFMVFDPVPAYKNAGWLVPAVGAGLAALVLTVILWPIAALVRRRYGARLALDAGSLRAYRWSKIAALLIVAAMGLWALVIAAMIKDNNNLTAKFDPILRAAQLFTFVAVVGGLAVMLWNLGVVWSGNRRWPAKTWSVVLALSSFAVLWFVFVCHLVGTSVNY
jgi:CubicO group peptidase (beta-lactamase class C family)